MVVNLDSSDRTWLQHADGLLALLSDPSALMQSSTNNLVRAAVKWHGGCRLHETSLEPELSPSDRASVLLNLTKLQLRSITTEMEELFQASDAPRRQLEVRRVRIAARDLYRNLRMIPLMTNFDPEGASEATRTPNDEALMGAHLEGRQANEFRMLLIIASSALLQAGEFLSPSHSYQQTNECNALMDVVREATKRIVSSVSKLIDRSAQELLGTPHFRAVAPHMEQPTHINPQQGLSLMWPLYCALGAPGLEEAQRLQIGAMLWTIGEQAVLPCALGMVGVRPFRSVMAELTQQQATPGNERAMSHSSAIAGLLVTSFLDGRDHTRA